jgi:hypothetical protein
VCVCVCVCVVHTRLIPFGRDRDALLQPLVALYARKGCATLSVEQLTSTEAQPVAEVFFATTDPVALSQDPSKRMELDRPKADVPLGRLKELSNCGLVGAPRSTARSSSTMEV